MAYTDVEWSHGDTPTEAKLDTMQGNLDYVREAMRARVIFQNAGTDRLYGVPAETDWQMRLTIGTYTFTSNTINSPGTFADVTGLRNKSITGLTLTVPYLFEISAVPSGYPTQLLLRGYWIRYSEGNRLSVFASAHAGYGATYAQYRGVTIIATRDNEGF